MLKRCWSSNLSIVASCSVVWRSVASMHSAARSDTWSEPVFFEFWVDDYSQFPSTALHHYVH